MSQILGWRPAEADLILLLVRVAFGLACIAHGWGKVTGIDGFAGKWKLSLPIAWAVAITQTLGGALLVVGLLHGWAALALAVCGAGITWKLIYDAKEPFMKPGQHSWDMGLMYTLLPLVLLATGPGRYAIDAMLR
jgi:putative oxidoreductase